MTCGHDIAEETAAKVDELIDDTSAYQEKERAKHQEEEERKAAAAKGEIVQLAETDTERFMLKIAWQSWSCKRQATEI